MSTRTLRQVTVTAPKTVQLLAHPLADAEPGPGEIAGPTLATVVSAGTELAAFYCAQGDRFPGHPGYAAVFEVERTGEGVDDFQPGDRAFAMGRHQSFQRCAAMEALPVPDGLCPPAAACARLAGISLTTFVTTTARPPEIALVTGLGPVGNFAAQAFRVGAYRVIGVDPDARRRDMASACGVTDVRERVPTDDPAVAGNVGVVAECSGHEQAVLDGLSVVRKRGEVVLIGVPWQRRTDRWAHDVLDKVFHDYAVLRSGWEWELPRHEEDFRPASIFNNFRMALDWIADGRMLVEDLIEINRPAEAPAVYRALHAGTADKLVQAFDWSQEESP